MSASASASSTAVWAASRNSGNPGRCRGTRLLAHHQHLTDPLFERLDPLADRRRRHMQAVGRRVEAAQFDHRGEGRELFTVQRHISDLMQMKIISWTDEVPDS